MQERHSVSVPETLEGWAVLHQMFRFDWPAWKRLPVADRKRALEEAVGFFSRISKPAEGESALYKLLGHKGDLLLLHFRKTFDELSEAETSLRGLALADYLKDTTSYVSVVELGLYEMTVKLHEKLLSEGLQPESEAWAQKWRAEMNDQRERMKGRLYPQIPVDRYLCFYPMDKKRGETANWYRVPIEKRQTMMRDHGMIGRKYAGQVTQVISGSIGFDDWEWGVDLFAKDPLVFKKLIYEMRFDEASALYAEFGPFYSGLRLEPGQLGRFLSGEGSV